MKRIDKDEFLKRGMKTLEELLEWLEKLPVIRLEDLQAEQTTLVIVDMINGFAREGALASPRVEALIPEVVKLSEKCGTRGIEKLAFTDNHPSDSPEFSAYPPHCMAGTSEAEVVEEIKEIGGYTLIPKNSTNGFHEAEFKKWLERNPQIDTFLITGDCTDICVQQLAITLKTWFNMQNRKSRIIVPANSVDTYDFGLHNGDLMHVTALYNMWMNGIELVEGVES